MPKVFQIAYSGELMFTREALLKSRGYVVESALGNEAARKALEAGSDDYHLFILGHPDHMRNGKKWCAACDRSSRKPRCWHSVRPTLPFSRMQTTT
jgi:hypothetical protein